GRGEVATPVRAAALAARERARHDEPRRGQLAVEVEPVLPGGVQRAVAWHPDDLQPLGETLERDRGHAEALAVAHEPDALPHEVTQLALDRVDLGPAGAAERPRSARLP